MVRKITQYISAMIASNGGFLSGALLSWSVAINRKIFPNNSENKEEFPFKISPGQFEWITSCLYIGGIIGAILAGTLMNVVGRKPLIMAAYVPYFIGYLLIVLARHFAFLIAARILLGMSLGCTTTVTPIYIGEIADKERRGALLTLFALFFYIGITFGVFASYVLPMLYYHVVLLALPVLLVSATPIIPDSPLYLIYANKSQRARLAIGWLRGPGLENDDMLKFYLSEMDRLRSVETGRFLNPFKEIVAQRTFIVAMIMTVFDQFTGIEAIIFYAESIFLVTKTQHDAFVYLIILTAVQCLSCLATFLLIDHVGRRILLFASSVTTAFSLAGIALYFIFRTSNPDTVTAFSCMLASFTVLYVICRSFGIGPILWVLVGELFPPHVKSYGSASCLTLKWLLDFGAIHLLSTLLGPTSLAVTFIVCTFITIMCCIFVAFCVVETNNLTCKEIEAAFRSAKMGKVREKEVNVEKVE